MPNLVRPFAALRPRPERAADVIAPPYDVVNADEARVLVQGVNMVKRHTRPAPGTPGGIVDKEASIHISNVAIADPKTGKPTRVGFKVLDDGRKVRIARGSGEAIDL